MISIEIILLLIIKPNNISLDLMDTMNKIKSILKIE